MTVKLDQYYVINFNTRVSCPNIKLKSNKKNL